MTHPLKDSPAGGDCQRLRRAYSPRPPSLGISGAGPSRAMFSSNSHDSRAADPSPSSHSSGPGVNTLPCHQSQFVYNLASFRQKRRQRCPPSGPRSPEGGREDAKRGAMFRAKSLVWLLASLLIAASLLACSAESVIGLVTAKGAPTAPPPVATMTPYPTFTAAPEATNTPIPAATPMPSPTPVQPTKAPVPPTNTPPPGSAPRR